MVFYLLDDVFGLVLLYKHKEISEVSLRMDVGRLGDLIGGPVMLFALIGGPELRGRRRAGPCSGIWLHQT